MKKSNNIIIAIVASIALSNLASAADSTGAAIEPYKLKNRSTFGFPSESRSPFWPIGWTRPKDEVVQDQRVASTTDSPKPVAPKLTLSAESFSVTSVLLGHPSIAVINGRSFEEGQYIPVLAGDERLRVQVRAIRDQGVWLQLDNQQPILVPMRRNTLPTRGPSPVISQDEWAVRITRQ